MKPSLKEFKHDFRELLLGLVWRQWSDLGVAGDTGPSDHWVVDPEALFLLSCTIARHDPRLFDEILDWMDANGRLINIMRLKHILKKEVFSGESVLAAVSGYFNKGTTAAKWKLLARLPKSESASEPLFLKEDGRPLPMIGKPNPEFARYGLNRGAVDLRGYSQEFRPMDNGTLILQLRALFGINVRCEILHYLMTHDTAHPSQIARDTYYFDRAVQGTLLEMSKSGLFQIRASNREKHYWLKRDQWVALLGRTEQPLPKWTNWPALFSALERVWIRLHDPHLLAADPLLQSSELRQLMLEIFPAFQRSGFDRSLSDPQNHLGKAYLAVFMSDLRQLLESLGKEVG